MSSIRYTFEAIGTSWQIAVFELLNAEKKQALEDAMHKRIDAFDEVYSRFRHDSLVWKLSQNGGTETLPDDAKAMLDLYKSLYAATDGQFTPLIGQTLVDAGYDDQYNFQKSKPLTSPPSWEEIISYDQHSITLAKPALLDFGAAGKGYLIDLVGGVLKDHGISAYTINAGGDVLHMTAHDQTLKVGLEHPDNPRQVIGVATITSESICASAGNKRRWGEFHHIMHPDTLVSANDVLATWVVAKDAMTADALATALFFVSPDILQQTYSFEYIILDNQMQASTSKGIIVDLFLK